MTRATNTPATRKRRKKIIKKAKGYIGYKRKLFKAANEQIMRSGMFAYRDRKVKKRNFRRLFIMRINNSLKLFNINYSYFMHLKKLSNISIDRKQLSEMSINNPKNFSTLVHEIIKSKP